jgi:hypothetical protein
VFGIKRNYIQLSLWEQLRGKAFEEAAMVNRPGQIEAQRQRALRRDSLCRMKNGRARGPGFEPVVRRNELCNPIYAPLGRLLG